MKIIIVDAFFQFVRGGAETNDYNLGRELVELDHEVNYIVGDNGETAQFSVPDGARVEKISVSGLDIPSLFHDNLLGKIRRFLFYRRFSRRIQANCGELLSTADLVLVTGRPNLSVIKKGLSAPLMYSVRGRMGWFNSIFLHRDAWMIFWGGCEADNPQHILEDRESLLLAPGVDGSVYFSASPDPELLQSLRAGDENALSVVFAGRLDPVKQVDHLIKVVGAANKAGKKVFLSIVGDGIERYRLEELTNSVAKGQVIFHGRQAPDTLADIMRASDVFMLTSRTENHPIAIKEAMACGLDVIAYDVGRVRKLVEGNHRNIVVEANDQNALLDALLERFKLERVDFEERVAAKPENWRYVAHQLVDWVEKRT